MELDLLIRYRDRGGHGRLLDRHRATTGAYGELGIKRGDGCKEEEELHYTGS